MRKNAGNFLFANEPGVNIYYNYRITITISHIKKIS